MTKRKLTAYERRLIIDDEIFGLRVKLLLEGIDVLDGVPQIVGPTRSRAMTPEEMTQLVVDICRCRLPDTKRRR